MKLTNFNIFLIRKICYVFEQLNGLKYVLGVKSDFLNSISHDARKGITEIFAGI
jgi:hypothetical protein